MESDNITAALHEIGGGTIESINKTIIAYDIVTANPPPTGFDKMMEEFIALVNVKINEGWSPRGVTLTLPGFCQAIVKYG